MEKKIVNKAVDYGKDKIVDSVTDSIISHIPVV
jgi:hypothetical protein